MITLQDADKKDYKSIKQLYLKAFPADERAPFYFLKRRVRQGMAKMLVVKNNGEFTGFVYTLKHNDLVYVFYLAISEEMRGSGIGSKTLSLIRDYYKDDRIFLAREQLDDSADNYEQRLKRHDFYIHNGLIDLPYEITEAGVTYDIMGYGNAFDIDDYMTMITNWTGRFYGKIVKMQARRTDKKNISVANTLRFFI